RISRGPGPSSTGTARRRGRWGSGTRRSASRAKRNVRAVRILVGILGAAVVAVMLAEFFVAFLLPRRVKRDPRIARGIYEAVWKPWRWTAHRLKPIEADALLGYFGPLALLLELAVWVFGLVVGYACLQWAGGGPFSLDVSA